MDVDNKVKCTDCGKPVQRVTPSLGNYCDKCWMKHIFVVPKLGGKLK